MTVDTDELVAMVNERMEAEDWSTAATILEGSADVVDRDAQLAWTLGWAYYKLGRHGEAVAALRTATRLDPNDGVAHWALGAALAEQGEHAAAERSYLRSLVLKDSALTRLSLACLYQKEGRLEEAESVHRQGIDLEPRHRERLEAYADFLSDTGRTREAAEVREGARMLPTREERRARRAKAQ